MFVAPTLIALAGIGVLGTQEPGLWLVGLGLELALPWAELALRRAAEVWAVWRTSAATAEPERLCPLMAELAEWAPYSATG